LGLGQVADRDAPGPGRAAGVQVGGARERSEQSGLARPVAADHADAVPGRHSERHPVQQRPLAVGLAGLLQVDQVHAGSPAATIAAPGTGPLATATPRQIPAPVSETARLLACRASLARNAQVGPDPDTIAPTAPCSRPAVSARRSSGRSVIAAGWRSLISAGPTAAGSPDRSAVISGPLSSGSSTPALTVPSPPEAARVARSRSQVAYTSGVDNPPLAKARAQ